MDATIPALLEEGLALHRQGATLEAERRYREVLRRDPDHADAQYYLAALACQQGRYTQAIEGANRALACGGDAARAHCLIGTALACLGRNEEALAAYDRAIAGNPRFARAHGERGDLLAALGRHEEAVVCYEAALALEPSSVEDWNRRAAACVRLRRFDDALASFERVVAFRPDDADAHNNRAQALIHLGREAEALQSLEQALAISPDHAAASATHANLLNTLGRHQEARVSAERLLARIPDHRGGLIAYSDALAALDCTEEAIAGLDRLLALRPDDSVNRYCKSLLLLNLGRLREGWPLYEERWKIGFGHERRNYPQPAFDGAFCRGIVLAWGEHGLGDQILYASMLEDLRQRAEGVVVEVEPRLVPLMSRSFPAMQVIGRGFGADPPLYPGRVDQQVAMGSLGAIFRHSLADFPRRQRGYLVADAARVQSLRARLAADGRGLVGVSWRSVNPQTGMSKSAALVDFAPLMRLSGCRFIDLQYGDTRQDRADCQKALGVQVERLPDVDATNDIDGLAALIAACDVVVTVSNTTAHLAGALGVPTWVMVPSGYARIWYWFKGEERSLWYPQVRVLRKAVGQSWEELIAIVAAEVARRRPERVARAAK
ncbi:MAG TPA: tetratricopeptide repeat protein [Xanthobacteraceae bacterium]|nr:tetratricopeptide repeat protein [Xanthobacteraceae bacterium]